MNYYNEWDKGAAAWLRELIKAGLIPNGYVDERSITEVTPADLEGFTQCHFFAGIGGWSYALQLAGIAPTTRIWTGSPPCQPFSVAGKQLGQLDERHLAPAFMRLVDQCRPPILFGEQVAAAIGKHWLDDLFTELERQGYACGAAVLPAASVGAPHKRDRLFFGASLGNASYFSQHRSGNVGASWRDEYSDNGSPCSVADADNARPQGRGGVPERPDQQPVGAAGMAGSMADASSKRRQQDSGSASEDEASHGRAGRDRGESDSDNLASGNVKIHSTDSHKGFWSDADWLACRDGKFRPVEARTQSLVDGISGGMGRSSDQSMRKATEEIGFPLGKNIPARVARLRGYGNAIVPQCAAEFIIAFAGSRCDAE